MKKLSFSQELIFPNSGIFDKLDKKIYIIRNLRRNRENYYGSSVLIVCGEVNWDESTINPFIL